MGVKHNMESIHLNFNFTPLTTSLAYGRSGNVTYINKRGKECVSRISNEWEASGSPRIDGDPRLKVDIVFTVTDRRRKDLDNLCKILIDTLVKCKVIVDDSRIDELHIYRKHGVTANTDVTITPIETKSIDVSGFDVSEIFS